MDLFIYLFSRLYSPLKRQSASLYSVKDTQNPASSELSYKMFLFTGFTPLQSPQRSEMDAHHRHRSSNNVLSAESVTHPDLVNPSLITTLDAKTR
jgi:hypothetical protein